MIVTPLWVSCWWLNSTIESISEPKGKMKRKVKLKEGFKMKTKVLIIFRGIK